MHRLHAGVLHVEGDAGLDVAHRQRHVREPAIDHAGSLRADPERAPRLGRRSRRAPSPACGSAGRWARGRSRSRSGSRARGRPPRRPRRRASSSGPPWCGHTVGCASRRPACSSTRKRSPARSTTSGSRARSGVCGSQREAARVAPGFGAPGVRPVEQRLPPAHHRLVLVPERGVEPHVAGAERLPAYSARDPARETTPRRRCARRRASRASSTMSVPAPGPASVRVW